jgi:3',5'-nucleoside bisphosphate phosphatase
LSINKYVDLHIHSNHSDGILSPEKIVEIAAKRELAAISITDHDQITAIKPAQLYAKKYNIDVIPGVEIDCVYDDFEVHILGYSFDIENSALKNYSQKLREWRELRAKKILLKLKSVGIRIPFELIQVKAKGAAIGRPHVADVLLEEGHVFSFNEAFYKYLGDDRPAFVPKKAIEPLVALNCIKEAGGQSFVAHPGVNVPRYVIEHFLSLGMDGIEAYHPQHSEVQIAAYSSLAKENGALISGGSDCHGARYGESVIGKGKVPYSVVERMMEKLISKKD